MKNLQLVFGIDKDNPLFSIYSPEDNPGMLEAAFAGHEIRRKMTPEIESYARSRFRDIYQDNRYDYSRIIRNEVNEHFGKALCAETLRPIFKQEKAVIAPPVRPVKNDMDRDVACDSGKDLSSTDEETRNQIPSKPHEEKAVFLHHAGILLLLHLIARITEGLPLRQLSCQWIISVLLGAVNIERSGRLDFISLAKLAGMEFLTSPRHQRIALKASSTEYNRMLLFRRNSDFINADGHRWYYYDPHGIRYTGIRRILKGWCGSVGKITRTHYRNSLEDTTSCEFDCIRYPFGKIPGYDRIIVRARRDGKEDIEVSVLVNGDELTAEQDAFESTGTRHKYGSCPQNHLSSTLQP